MRGFTAATKRLSGCTTIHIADREGDHYTLLGGALEQKQRFVIRVRVSERRARTTDGAEGTLKELAQSRQGMFHREVPLSSRKAPSQPRAAKTYPPRAARSATLEFSATEVEIRKPRYVKDLPDALTLNMIHVREPNPPLGEKPIEWLLFTTESVATDKDIEDVVDLYRARWLIEECNKALKTGCQYEQRQLESREALLTLLAMSLPIACELLWLRSECRSRPDRPAKDILRRFNSRFFGSSAPTRCPLSRPCTKLSGPWPLSVAISAPTASPDGWCSTEGWRTSWLTNEAG